MKGFALHGLVDAMDDVFLVSLPFLAIALIIAIITPEQRLAGRNDGPKAEGESPESLESSAAAAMHRYATDPALRFTALRPNSG